MGRNPSFWDAALRAWIPMIALPLGEVKLSNVLATGREPFPFLSLPTRKKEEGSFCEEIKVIGRLFVLGFDKFSEAG